MLFRHLSMMSRPPRLRGALPPLALVALFALGAAFAPGGAFAAAASPEGSDLDAVLARIDAAHEKVDRFRAQVREIRRLALLAEPELLEGQLVYERPGRVRWEYTSPERRIYVLDEGELTGWLPAEKRVEKLDMSHRRRRLERIVAIGQSSEALTREFRVELVGADPAAGADELRLVPRSRRVKRRVNELRLWVDRDTGLVERIRYETGEGDSVELAMSDFELNPELPPDHFELEIPEGAEVVEGLSSLGFGEDDDERR